LSLRLVIVAAGALLAPSVALAVALSAGGGEPTRTVPRQAATGHSKPAAVRTLVVYRGRKEPAASASSELMRALRLSGSPPHEPIVARVLSDEDCAPDGAGISHCRNEIRLTDGHVLTVRHPHDMTQVACMTPGERVRVVSA